MTNDEWYLNDLRAEVALDSADDFGSGRQPKGHPEHIRVLQLHSSFVIRHSPQ
jgi:hypothetical protein